VSPLYHVVSLQAHQQDLKVGYSLKRGGYKMRKTSTDIDVDTKRVTGMAMLCLSDTRKEM
jgi:hypothetical protein